MSSIGGRLDGCRADMQVHGQWKEAVRNRGPAKVDLVRLALLGYATIDTSPYQRQATMPSVHTL